MITELTSYCLDNYEEIKAIKYCNKIGRKFNDNYKRGTDRFIKTFQVFKVLIVKVDQLITPMELTDEVLNTQFYDTVNDYNTLEYNLRNCRLGDNVERNKDQYKILFDFETITSEYKHMSYPCWIYNGDIQQEFIGINKCAVDMLNALPTAMKEISLIAHSSDYDCIFILEYLQNVQPIVKSNIYFYRLKQPIITLNLKIILILLLKVLIN